VSALRVVVSPQALRDLTAQFDWWREHRSPQQAARWLDAALERIEQVGSSPDAHPRSQEADELGVELRDCLFGLSRRVTHRAVFQIRANTVFVITVRSVSQGPLTADDLVS
jgi:plasmid stabilization system protein ParE